MRVVNASPRVLSVPGWQASIMEIRYLQPDGLVRSPAFSHGAVIPPGATTIYIGGQNGVDETGKVASHDAAAQAARPSTMSRLCCAPLERRSPTSLRGRSL